MLPLNPRISVQRYTAEPRKRIEIEDIFKKSDWRELFLNLKRGRKLLAKEKSFVVGVNVTYIQDRA
jgi:hypothetical protein